MARGQGAAKAPLVVPGVAVDVRGTGHQAEDLPVGGVRQIVDLPAGSSGTLVNTCHSPVAFLRRVLTSRVSPSPLGADAMSITYAISRPAGQPRRAKRSTRAHRLLERRETSLPRGRRRRPARRPRSPGRGGAAGAIGPPRHGASRRPRRVGLRPRRPRERRRHAVLAERAVGGARARARRLEVAALDPSVTSYTRVPRTVARIADASPDSERTLPSTRTAGRDETTDHPRCGAGTGCRGLRRARTPSIPSSTRLGGILFGRRRRTRAGAAIWLSARWREPARVVPSTLMPSATPRAFNLLRGKAGIRGVMTARRSRRVVARVSAIARISSGEFSPPGVRDTRAAIECRAGASMGGEAGIRSEPSCSIAPVGSTGRMACPSGSR